MQKIEGFIDYGSEGWDRFFNDLGTTWRDKDYRFLDEVFDLSRISGSLLDVGCGLGDGQKLLYQKCTRVSEFHACDFSPHAIETCRLNEDLRRTAFFAHDLMENPLPRKYGTVICLQTLEHVQDPVAGFRKLVDAAEDLLIVSTPFLNRRPDENHLWSFDEKDFSEFGCTTFIAQKSMNIFWLLDKKKQGYRFRNRLMAKMYRSKNKFSSKFSRYLG